MQRRGFGVLARLRSLPAKADEFRSRLRELAGLTRHERGCISCEMIENACDATEYTLLEEWSDEESHYKHFCMARIQEALRFFPNLLSGELDPHKYAVALNMVRYGTNSYSLAECQLGALPSYELDSGCSAQTSPAMEQQEVYGEE